MTAAVPAHMHKEKLYECKQFNKSTANLAINTKCHFRTRHVWARTWQCGWVRSYVFMCIMKRITRERNDSAERQHAWNNILTRKVFVDDLCLWITSCYLLFMYYAHTVEGDSELWEMQAICENSRVNCRLPCIGICWRKFVNWREPKETHIPDIYFIILRT